MFDDDLGVGVGDGQCSGVAAPEPESTETPDVVARYDANGNGAFDIAEYIQAPRDYAYRRISDAE